MSVCCVMQVMYSVVAVSLTLVLEGCSHFATDAREAISYTFGEAFVHCLPRLVITADTNSE